MAVKSPTTDLPPIAGSYQSGPPKPGKKFSLTVVIGKAKPRNVKAGR